MASAEDDYRLDVASSSGGLVFHNPKEGEMLRRSLQYLITRVSSNVISGNVNFTRMSMPVHLNEPRSLLQRITDDWVYAPHYLPAAASATDPVRRLKLVAAFVVGGLHCVRTLGKPFNPILGSTYRARLEDGSPCFVEQTSHHPPVTHYTIRPEGGQYLLAGFSGIDGRVEWGLDSALSSRRIGINVIQFADGSRIVYNLPRMLVRGLTSERKVEFVGPFSLFYEEHGLVFDILLNPPRPGFFRTRSPSDYLDGVLYKLPKPVGGSPMEGEVAFTEAFARRDGAFFGDPDDAKRLAAEQGYTAVELRPDAEVSRSITTATHMRESSRAHDVFNREIIAYARGTFLGYLDVDGERIWDIRRTPKSEVLPRQMVTSLHSDCRGREDIVVLQRAADASDDEESRERLTVEAQNIKERLENIQRTDRRWRREGPLREGVHDESAQCEGADRSNDLTASIETASSQGGSRSSPEERLQDTKSTIDKSNDGNGVAFFPSSLGGL